MRVLINGRTNSMNANSLDRNSARGSCGKVPPKIGVSPVRPENRISPDKPGIPKHLIPRYDSPPFKTGAPCLRRTSPLNSPFALKTFRESRIFSRRR
ncbi:hypothetical protein GWI33_007955 [Rhynchophorus ferrugineus]|uniref:Uncharacterized protein n=1 Tax=Rhynchophorus ferrugineus TaxID=354439 RepID=A0A834MHX2_RHYFE|nr:hypothetical protein GWI33_007955 [Rhynchophorus ferrugineus]